MGRTGQAILHTTKCKKAYEKHARDYTQKEKGKRLTSRFDENAALKSNTRDTQTALEHDCLRCQVCCKRTTRRSRRRRKDMEKKEEKPSLRTRLRTRFPSGSAVVLQSGVDNQSTTDKRCA